MSYKEKKAVISRGNGFRDKLRTLVESIIRIGRDDWRLNHEMSDDTFDLGCAVNNFKPFDYRLWGHWMMDADVVKLDDRVVVHHRSQFYCTQAEDALGKLLNDYFALPVRFRISHEVQERVRG